MKFAPLVAVVLSGVAAAALAATPSPADRAFVAKVSQGGMFEVQAGQLAERVAAAPDVRDFGATEVHDHMLVNAKLRRIATSEGLPVPTALNAEFAAKLARLQSLKGKAFDDAYMSEMLTLHEGDGAAFGKEGADGGSPAFQAFGTETQKIVARHIGAIRGSTPPAR